MSQVVLFFKRAQLLSLGLLELRHLCARLVTHHTATPMFSDLIETIVEVGAHHLDQLGEGDLIEIKSRKLEKCVN